MRLRRRRDVEPYGLDIEEIRATTLVVARLRAATDRMEAVLSKLEATVNEMRDVVSADEEGQDG